MTDVGFSPGGTARDGARPRARRRARRAARRARAAGRRPPRRGLRRVRALAALPRRVGAARRSSARDDVEAYAYFRVGYHRGLDRLRQSGWRGSGYVRWRHETNRGFLRALEGLRSAAEAIGEADEAQRCAEFLLPAGPGAGTARSRRSVDDAVKRALITGITGQDGRHLSQFLADQGLPGVRARARPGQPEDRAGAEREPGARARSKATCATSRR